MKLIGSMMFTIVFAAAATALQAQPRSIEAQGNDIRQGSSDSAAWTDRQIARRVELQLERNDLVPAHAIDVEVRNGVVTLGGQAEQLAAKRTAARIAQEIRGVQDVQNEIQVTGARWNDSAIRAQLQAALSENPVTRLDRIDVQVRNGIATLSGEVQSYHSRRMAEESASNIAGVRGVRNRIEVQFSGNRPDHELKAEIESRLAWNSSVDSDDVEVAVNEGIVQLSGLVNSVSHRRAVSQVAATVPGVLRVDAAQLHVNRVTREQRTASRQQKAERQAGPESAGRSAERESESSREAPATPDKDEALRSAIKRELQADPEVNQGDFQVEVEDGLVTLTGQVESLWAKRKAAQLASQTAGTDRIYNFLKVRSQESASPQEVANRVQKALGRDAYLHDSELGVDYRTGRIILMGTVDTHAERTRAEIIASQVAGVMTVLNQVRVSRESSSNLNPSNSLFSWGTGGRGLKEEVEEQLFWSPFVDADEVRVTVQGPVVTLSGTVSSASERQSAEANAYEAGAPEVNNRLVVKSDDEGLFDF